MKKEYQDELRRLDALQDESYKERDFAYLSGDEVLRKKISQEIRVRSQEMVDLLQKSGEEEDVDLEATYRRTDEVLAKYEDPNPEAWAAAQAAVKRMDAEAGKPVDIEAWAARLAADSVKQND